MAILKDWVQIAIGEPLLQVFIGKGVALGLSALNCRRLE